MADLDLHHTPIIVGLEASTDRLEELEAFFQALPDTRGMAFVVTPSLDPDEHRLDEILEKSVSMPVTRVTESVQVEPGRVYVLPPDDFSLVHPGGSSGRARIITGRDPVEVPEDPSRPRERTPDAGPTSTEEKLRRTRVQLHELIAQHEASQVELLAQNEELQRTNQELSTLAEALKARREEAQAAAEELQTVNDELTKKVEELTRAKSDIENLMVSSEVAALFLDRQLCIQRFTPRVRDFFNISSSDLGRPLAELAHRLDHDDLLADAKAVLTTLRPKTCEIRSEEGRWYLTRIRPYRTIDDRIDGVTLTFTDFTKQMEAQARMRKLQERFREMVHSIDAIVFEGDHRTWTFTFVNQAAEDLLGYPVERWYEPYFWITRIVHPDDRKWVAETILTKVEERQNHEVEFRAVRADGAVVWLRGLLHLTLDEDGAVKEVRGVMVEITQRKRAEEQLRILNETLEERVQEKTEQVRSLAASLTLAEQRERQRVAQILHDDLQQILYGLDMTLNMLRTPRSEEERATLRDQADETLSLAIETTRSLSVQLSPPVLKNGNLQQLLQWISIRKQEMHDLEVDVHMLTPCRVANADVLVLIYQFLRELLFNVVKHAGTNQATVTAREEDGDVILVVEDDGEGFDPDAVLHQHRESGGFGLANIRERVELVGGRFTIDSAPEAGTRVVIAVPTQVESR